MKRMTTQLREVLAKGPVMAPGCFDAFSARLAELAGFEALHLTGLGVEATQLGAPDLGLLTMTELASHAARMADAVNVPIIADIDTGFGGVLNVRRTIREMERAGVAGVHIEDQALPKRCPLLGGRKTVSRGEALDRLHAALDARSDPDFVIVARSDADTISFDELIARCNLYLEAGADLVMPVLISVDGGSYYNLTPDEQMVWNRRMCGAINGPVMGMGASTPRGYTAADMADAGFTVIMTAARSLAVAANAMAGLFAEMKATGTDAGYIDANPGPYHDAMELMRAARLEDYVATEQRFTTS